MLRRVHLESNHADRGAGLYGRGAELVVTGSLIAHNDASTEGGGVYLAPGEPSTGECPCPIVDPPAVFRFVVVDGNTADAAAAIWNGAPGVTVESSIVSGHSGSAVAAAPGRAPAWRYVDAFPATFAGMANPTGSNGNLSADPQFDAEHHLGAASACIDAADPAYQDHDGSRADMGMFGGPEAP
jgi:hypothetical protein